MTNISKQNVSDELQLEISRQLTSLLTAKNFHTTDRILNSLLTKAELTMLAKRIAIILLIDSGHGSYQIAKLLKVSQTTVSHFLEKYEKGDFNDLTKHCRQKRNQHPNIALVLEKILNGGLPSRGKERWRSLQ